MRVETQSSRFQFTAALDNTLVSMCRQWNLQSDSHFIESLLHGIDFEQNVFAQKAAWLSGRSLAALTLNSTGLEHDSFDFSDSFSIDASLASTASAQASHSPAADVWSSISAKIGCSPKSARLRFLWLARGSNRIQHDNATLSSLSAGFDALNLYAHPQRLAILNILIMALSDTDSATAAQPNEQSEQDRSQSGVFPTAFPSLDATLRRSRAA